MKTTINTKRSLQDFKANWVRATVDLLVDNSYKEEKDWLTSKPFSFNFFVKQKAKKGYGFIKYGLIVKDRYKTISEEYTKDQIKCYPERVKVCK
nr:MAG TPA: hypothetical protein [Caudoviricetes sp.]